MNRWNLIGYVALWVGMLFAVGFTGYESSVREREVARAIQVNCFFGNENRQAMRAILADANRRTQTSQQRTAAEKKAAQTYYETQIARLKPFDCERLVQP